jgi:Icc-related predicted phosphoesterase
MENLGTSLCVAVSDLHGSIRRYRRLFRLIEQERPRAVFIAGDLLPFPMRHANADGVPAEEFVGSFLTPESRRLQTSLGKDYPSVFLIMGNDDPCAFEDQFTSRADGDLWFYMHNRRTPLNGYDVYGYACVPPTPFRLKDWERYDVSRYTDPGCISPEEGQYSVNVDMREVRHATIQNDLAALTAERDLQRSIFLFHTPPYQTMLDRTALDGRIVDHVPMDVHTGSIAVRRLIERRQPLLTIHGHIHESERLTGEWRDRIGRTHLFSAAHDGPELAVVRFRLDDLGNATRDLLPVA